MATSLTCTQYPYGVMLLTSDGRVPCDLMPVVKRAARHAYPGLWLEDIPLTECETVQIARACRSTLNFARVACWGASLRIASLLMDHASNLQSLDIQAVPPAHDTLGWSMLLASIHGSTTLKTLSLMTVTAPTVGRVLECLPPSVRSLQLQLVDTLPGTRLPACRLERLVLAGGNVSLGSVIRYARSCEKLREILLVRTETTIALEDVTQYILGADEPWVLGLHCIVFDANVWHPGAAHGPSMLRALSLRGCSTARVLLPHIVAHCMDIETLDVSDMVLTGEALCELIRQLHAGHLPRLVCLNMAGNQITEAVLQAITKRLPTRVQILGIARSVRRSHDVVKPAVRQFLQWLTGATHLRGLDVSGKTFTRYATEHLIHACPPLEYVKIQHVPTQGPTMLARLYALQRMINVAVTDDPQSALWDESAVLVPFSGASEWARWTPAGHMRMHPMVRKTIELFVLVSMRYTTVGVIRDVLRHVVCSAPEVQTLFAPTPVFGF